MFFLPSSTTLEITLFSQPTERAGTHAGVWKQEFPPARRGVRGGILFAYFARIIPDTRPSGSLRSRKIAPGDFFRYALLWCAAHSVTHLMCAPSFAPLRVSSLIRALRVRFAREKSLPAIFSRLAYRKIYCAHPHSAYTRNRFFAYQPQVTRRREPPPMPFAHHRGVSRYKLSGVSRYHFHPVHGIFIFAATSAMAASTSIEININACQPSPR